MKNIREMQIVFNDFHFYNAKIVYVVRVKEVTPYEVPGISRWGNRFGDLNDRGSPRVFKIVSRNLTCLMRYTFREDNLQSHDSQRDS